MFQGTVPSEMRSLIAKNTKNWECSDIYVGCSGNFTIERTLHSDHFALHGNDVQIFSSAIGNYLSGNKIDITIDPDYLPQFEWLLPYMETEEGKLAVILISSTMLQGLDKDNDYFRRMNEAYRVQFPEIFEKTIKKVTACDVKLTSFFCGDVMEYIKEMPQEQGFISFPPFYSGGYEKMFEKLQKVFLWIAPQYEMFTEESFKEFIDIITSKRYWLFGTRFENVELAPYLQGKIKTTNRAMPFYVYSNNKSTVFVQPNQKCEPCKIERIGEKEEIGDRLSVTVLPMPQFNALRSVYLNPRISPASPSAAIGVLLDKKLIGCFALSTSPTLTQWDNFIPGPHIYLMTDFAIRPTKHPKLSKLVLYALLSKETKLLCERLAGRRQNAVVTTAFSQNPASMKYRGLFELLTRKEEGGGFYKYKLNYGSQLGKWTLSEGLALWKKKYLK